MKNKFAWISLAGTVGLISAFWQLMEKLAILKNKNVVLSCNFNDVFSCSSVLNAHQSSILGPPNALIGVIMFSFFLTIGLVGLTGSRLHKKLLGAVQFLALFMLGFTLWFLFESIYRIQAICIFCLFIGTAILIINAGLLRLSAPIRFKRLLARGADLFIWSLIWLIVAFAMIIKFA